MAVISIKTNDGNPIALLRVTNAHGPWTDGDTLEDIAEQINIALAEEGDRA